MFELLAVESLAEIQEQRELYMNELPYSQDLNVEENVWESQCYKIIMDSVNVGYFCVDSKKTLWEFYLIESVLMHSQTVFKFLIDMNYIAAAECKTYDYLLMSLCFDFHKKAVCSAYLFRDDADVKYSLSPLEGIKMRLAAKEDFNSLSKINNIAKDVNFFHDLEEDIRNKEVFIFHSDGELLGAGTCKKIWHRMNHRDIGMLVAEKHRKKGIGASIIMKLKEYCYNNNLIPVCGCWYYNYESKKALEKAGFITKHRIIKFYF